MIWNVKEYGAVDDGATVCTTAIQTTIDRCHQAGGGTVLIEGGEYLCGTIFLRSNVTLEVAQGAVLRASPYISDYAENTHYNRYRNEKAWKIIRHGQKKPYGKSKKKCHGSVKKTRKSSLTPRMRAVIMTTVLRQIDSGIMMME